MTFEPQWCIIYDKLYIYMPLIFMQVFIRKMKKIIWELVRVKHLVSVITLSCLDNNDVHFGDLSECLCRCLAILNLTKQFITTTMHLYHCYWRSREYTLLQD